MRLLGLIVAAVLACVLCGCATQAEQLTDASASGVSAVRSSALALELAADGREWRHASDTALADALTELSDAHRTLIELVPGDAEQEQARDSVADALQRALGAVAGARAALAHGDELDGWIAQLDDAADALEGAAG
jgi:hypothetical protein